MRDIPAFVMYCVYGESCSFLLIKSTDSMIKKFILNGMQLNYLSYYYSNKYINLNAGRLLLLSVIRLNIEYGSEVWEGNKSQAGSFESIIIESVHSIIGTLNSCLIRNGILNHVEEGKGKCGVAWWLISLNL